MRRLPCCERVLRVGTVASAHDRLFRSSEVGLAVVVELLLAGLVDLLGDFDGLVVRPWQESTPPVMASSLRHG